MINKNEWLIVGLITSCHGINGQGKVKSLSDFEERFLTPGIRWLNKEFLTNSYFLIYNSKSPFGGLMIRKLFFISTNGTISLTNGIRTLF